MTFQERHLSPSHSKQRSQEVNATPQGTLQNTRQRFKVTDTETLLMAKKKEVLDLNIQNLFPKDQTTSRNFAMRKTTTQVTQSMIIIQMDHSSTMARMTSMRCRVNGATMLRSTISVMNSTKDMDTSGSMETMIIMKRHTTGFSDSRF